MIQKQILLFLLPLLFSLSLWAQPQEPLFYTVNKNDTLSLIAIKIGTPYSAIYGRGGRLDKLLQLNPQITNPNRITPGEKVQIGWVESSTEALREVAQEEEAKPISVSAESESPKAETAYVAAEDPGQEPQSADMKFGIKLGFVFTKIMAEDPRNASSAVFTSELDPEIAILFSQPLFSDLDFYSEFRWKQNKFKAPTTGQTLEQPKASLNLYGLIQRKMTSHLGLGLYFGLKDKLFSRAASLTLYTFDSATVPYIGVKLKYDFLSEENRSLGFNLNYGFVQSSKASSHEVQHGSESRIAFFLENKRGLYSFEQEIFVEKSQQNTNLVNQNETLAGFLFKFGKSF